MATTTTEQRSSIAEIFEGKLAFTLQINSITNYPQYNHNMFLLYEVYYGLYTEEISLLYK